MRSVLICVGMLATLRAHAQPHEFLDEAKALMVVGACGEGKAPVKPEIYAAHCKKVRAVRDDYQTKWLALANDFFRAHVPANVPKTVVYPFAGGDLSTARTAGGRRDRAGAPLRP